MNNQTEQPPMEQILGMVQQLVARQPEKLLSDRQVAEILCMSREQVWILNKEGALPKPLAIVRPDRKKGATRWRQSEITTYINSLPVID